MEPELTKRARKGLDEMPRWKEMAARLERIAADPFVHHPGVTPVKGERNTCRLRVGDWRAIYQVDSKSKVVTVLNVAPRATIYRK